LPPLPSMSVLYSWSSILHFFPPKFNILSSNYWCHFSKILWIFFKWGYRWYLRLNTLLSMRPNVSLRLNLPMWTEWSTRFVCQSTSHQYRHWEMFFILCLPLHRKKMSSYWPLNIECMLMINPLEPIVRVEQ
jgi:hypothetical protein